MRARLQARRRRVDSLALYFIGLVALGVVLVGSLFVWLRINMAVSNLGAGADSLNPVERSLLFLYLSTHASDLKTPLGDNPAPIVFTVQTGETVAEVVERLTAQNLANNPQLIKYYIRYQGLDGQVEAGEFILRQTMTVPEIALALTDAQAREITARVTEGWRREQIAAALGTDPNLAVNADEFLALTGSAHPPFSAYLFLNELPPGASLEGFLFPDTYLFKPGASAMQVVEKMLTNFESRLPDDYEAAIKARGLTLYQAVTFASLIEREAVIAEERPLIASVIFNRLIIGQPLEIDATVQYALGAPDNWWPRLDTLDLRSISSPYNTYLSPALPIGPIANPGLQSLLAVAQPADSKFLYYRARCDGSGAHLFAENYETHLANACP